jgi:hypothetical protein
MVRKVSALALWLMTTVAAAGQPAVIGSSARQLLSAHDIDQITRLATAGDRTVWLMDVSRSMILPEEWHVDAYLLADGRAAQKVIHSPLGK